MDLLAVKDSCCAALRYHTELFPETTQNKLSSYGWNRGFIEELSGVTDR